MSKTIYGALKFRVFEIPIPVSIINWNESIRW